MTGRRPSARIAVRDVLGYLAGGTTVGEVPADLPELTTGGIRARLSYAADHLPRPAG